MDRSRSESRLSDEPVILQVSPHSVPRDKASLHQTPIAPACIRINPSLGSLLCCEPPPQRLPNALKRETHMANLTQLGDRVIADIVRSSLPFPRARNVSASTAQDRLQRGLGMSNCRSLRMLLTVREIALLLQCHPETIYRQIKSKDLPAKRHGHRWKFDLEEVATWLEQCATKRKVALSRTATHHDGG